MGLHVWVFRYGAPKTHDPLSDHIRVRIEVARAHSVVVHYVVGGSGRPRPYGIGDGSPQGFKGGFVGVGGFHPIKPRREDVGLDNAFPHLLGEG